MVVHKRVKSEITKVLCNFMTIAWRAKTKRENNKKKTAMQHEKGNPTLSAPLESPVPPPVGVSRLYPTLVDTDNKTPPPPYAPEFSNNKPFRPVPQQILQGPTLTIKGGILEIEEPVGGKIHTQRTPSAIMADIVDVMDSRKMQMPHPATAMLS